MSKKKGMLWLPALVMGMLSVFLVFTAGCKKSDTGIDLSPFIQMAQNETCNDIKNRLFVIDGDKVLYDKAGNCSDAAYSVVLYGETIDQILAEEHDSIAGPMGDVHDDAYRSMFETIRGNLDNSDLGLGSSHTVEVITF